MYDEITIRLKEIQQLEYIEEWYIQITGNGAARMVVPYMVRGATEKSQYTEVL
jgi:hypothetical protein